MSAISSKLGEFLIKTTHANDINEAFHWIFSDYLNLKLEHLNTQIEQYRSKYGISFKEFSNRIKEGTLEGDTYSYNTEKDFWKWEEAETLKAHYEELKSQWM